MHACIHTYIHANLDIHMCIQTCIHTYMHAYMHHNTLMRAYIHTHIHTWIHNFCTCMHTYVHAYIHIHIHAYEISRHASIYVLCRYRVTLIRCLVHSAGWVWGSWGSGCGRGIGTAKPKPCQAPLTTPPPQMLVKPSPDLKLQ